MWMPLVGPGGRLDYADRNEGDAAAFTGVEEIGHEGVACYRLHYAGGVID